MGALEMGLEEDELQPLVTMWRGSNPNIVRFWWAVDKAAMSAVRDHVDGQVAGIHFSYGSGMLFIRLPSGRVLSYVKPRIGTNQFGSDCITYEGVGTAKKWERLETYGPKLVENIVQATARDILCYAMRTLSHCFITMHIHDELVIECSPSTSLDEICKQMGRTPPWAQGLLLRADGYETDFYKKD
jgi:DNA polymerase